MRTRLFGPYWWTNVIFGVVLGIVCAVLHLSTAAFLVAVVAWSIGRTVEEEITERRVRGELLTKLEEGLKAANAAQAMLTENIARRERMITELTALRADLRRVSGPS